MLFSSYVFILVFLPVTLVGYFLLSRNVGRRQALIWLLAASLVYYGWWKFSNIWILFFSTLFNYALGVFLSSTARDRLRWMGLVLGVTVNLALLGYFKYFNFFADTVNTLFGTLWEVPPIVLPLAISFFTFQQIAYLVDSYRRLTSEYRFLHYALFVTFFPQLIAGPIVHHKEILPQFERKAAGIFSVNNLAVGLSIFVVGLFKKVVIADNIALYSDPLYAVAEAGAVPSLVDAWAAALGFAFHVYFDFSGYSDMAIGLARMFGIRLPENFASPYKATSIIEFWRRWHVTLSRFVRDYVYIPLGGNRKGRVPHYTNIMISMVLIGLWHGAGWTFVAFGALHGLYLIINHVWRIGRRDSDINNRFPRTKQWTGRIVTFLAVVASLPLFRAESFESAGRIAVGMVGAGGKHINDSGVLIWIWFLILLGWVWLLPNTQQWMHRFRPVVGKLLTPAIPDERLTWKPNWIWAFVLAIMFVTSFVQLHKVQEFLYYQF